MQASSTTENPHCQLLYPGLSIGKPPSSYYIGRTGNAGSSGGIRFIRLDFQILELRNIVA
jgi:hypothetical protein